MNDPAFVLPDIARPAPSVEDGQRPSSPAQAGAPRSLRGIVLEFARYFAASAAALGVDVGLFRLSLHLGAGYPSAALVGFCAGAAVAYLASVRWVFGARSVRHAGVEFVLFVAVGVAGLLLTEVLLWLEIGRWGLPPVASKFGAAAVVFVFNFVVRKAMLFRAPAR